MKLVLCGLWHVHAEGYYLVAKDYAQIVGVYEPNVEWRDAFCEKYDLKPLLSIEEVLASGADGAIVCCATSEHTALILRLVTAGMDIFTEKVLATTGAECEQIAAAVEQYGVRFVISEPHKYRAEMQTVKKIVDSGILGKINYFRYRNVHTGSSMKWLPPHFYNQKECGGGAMIDLGAHGMYMSEWLCGMPISAQSTFTRAVSLTKEETGNFDGVEDNAVTVMRYANGAIAVNETGFCSLGCPILLEVGGEGGRVYTEGEDVYLCTATDKIAKKVEKEESLPMPIEQFCCGKILPDCDIEAAKKLTCLMEMAYSR